MGERSSTRGPGAAQQYSLAEGRWILIAMILASSMAGIDASALNVSLPAIQKSFQASGTQLVWVVNAYALMLAALILVGGSLGDLFGRRRVMIVGLLIFTVSSLACAISPSIQLLVGARVVQGLGAALLIPGSLAIMSAVFSDQVRGKAIGIWSSVSAMMMVFGPVLGGLLSTNGHWRFIFLINVPLGLITLLLLVYKVPESKSSEGEGETKLDYLGTLLVASGLGLLTYGLTEWAQNGSGSRFVLISIAIGAVLLLGFVAFEAKTKQPMVRLDLFKSRVFSGLNLMTLCLYGALTGVIFFLSINLIQVQGYSALQVGLSFMAFPLPIILFSRYFGGLASRIGARWMLVCGPALSGLSFIYLGRLGITSGPSAYWTSFFPGQIAFGLGMAITVAPLTNAVMGAVGKEISGTASGINNAVTRSASVLALAVLGSVAILNFEQNMRSETASLHLPAATIATFKLESRRLAGAKADSRLSASLQPVVQGAFKRAFSDTYRMILSVCAGLAFLSAFISLISLSGEKQPLETVT